MRQKKAHKFLSSNKLSERFVLRSLVHILLSYSVTVWTHITANLYCISLSKREKCAQADAVHICGNILYV